MGTSQGSKSLKREGEDFLINLASEVKNLVEAGFYEIEKKIPHSPLSLKRAIKRSRYMAIITEVKFSSPSLGKIGNKDEEVASIVSKMERGGATGISVLTQPLHFEGSPENFTLARLSTSLPMLMKDIIVDERQIEAGYRLGADVILLIERLFYRDGFGSLDRLINSAHRRGLEVLLEVNSRDEFERAIRSDAEIIGINNRDLGSLDLDLETTSRILSSRTGTEKPIISESGIESRDEIEKMSQLGASAVLVGTSIMKSGDIESKVRELASATRRR